jgi:membrane-associated protein
VFLVWQTLGGAAWAIGLTVAGHVLGTYLPGVDQYLLPVVAVVVIVSLLPLAIELVRERRRRRTGGSAHREEPEAGEPDDDAVDAEGA